MLTTKRLSFALPFCLALAACTDAAPTPARGAFQISPGGCGLTLDTVPSGSGVGQISPNATEQQLADLLVLKDGDGGEVQCTVAEAAPGQYELSLELNWEGRDFGLYGTTANNQGVNASLTYKSPRSGGETFVANDCTINTSLMREGGGEGFVEFECFVLSTPTQPDRACPALGQVYVKNCKRK